MSQPFYIDYEFHPDSDRGLVHIMPTPPFEILDDIRINAEVNTEAFVVLNDQDEEWKNAVLIPKASLEDVVAFSALAKHFLKMHGHTVTETFVDATVD